MSVKKLEEMTLEEVAEWVCNTCLTLGTSPSTAYKVAATFIDGLESKISSNRSSSSPSK